jgi:hypothetical protein
MTAPAPTKVQPVARKELIIERDGQQFLNTSLDELFEDNEKHGVLRI